MNFHLILSYRLKGTVCRYLERFSFCFSLISAFQSLSFLAFPNSNHFLFNSSNSSCSSWDFLLSALFWKDTSGRNPNKSVFLLLMSLLQEPQSDSICCPIFENNHLIYFSCFLVVYISRWCLLLITLSWPKVKVLAQNFDHFYHTTCSKIWPLENFCYSRFAWTHIL